VTSNAPRSKLDSSTDAFLTFFDRDSGQLRSATYAGIEGTTWVVQQAVDSDRDVAIGGGYVSGNPPSGAALGYVLRWQPVENRFVFSARFEAPVASLVFNGSNLYFALLRDSSPDSRIQIGTVDANGKQQGSIVSIN